MKPEPRRQETQKERRKRVASLKAQVDAGTYTIDPGKVSKKIIEAHLSKSAGPKKK